MLDENAQKAIDAYRLFAVAVGIDPKDYDIFAIDHDGDVITIRPGTKGKIVSDGMPFIARETDLEGMIRAIVREELNKRL
jgi:hypothetical protein